MLIPDTDLGEWAERPGWFAVPECGTWYRIVMRNCSHDFLLPMVPFWPHCPQCGVPTYPSVSYEVIRG